MGTFRLGFEEDGDCGAIWRLDLPDPHVETAEQLHGQPHPTDSIAVRQSDKVLPRLQNTIL